MEGREFTLIFETGFSQIDYEYNAEYPGIEVLYCVNVMKGVGGERDREREREWEARERGSTEREREGVEKG